MAAKLNLKIEQGATFQALYTWKDSTGTPVNLTGWTARMQIRPSVKSATIYLELTTENTYITLGGTAGTISIDVPASITEDITWECGEYDLELVNGTFVKRLLEGNVTVKKEITR